MCDKTVLIIDDEPRMADSLRDLLRGAGYRAEAAYGGQEGIERIKREPFQVIVTDLRMQGIDGIEVIRFIHETSPRSLIIVITGHATTESAIQAVHFQVFDYLRKPFEFDLFRMAIEKAFARIETEQLRQDTAAMITHDIKIPLTSIIGFAAMLYDRDRGQFHPRAREFSETILSNGQRILALIENYLTTCKIDAGTLQPVPTNIDMAMMLRDLVETAQPEAIRRGLRLEADVPPDLGSVCLDEALVYRAVANLVQNAIKYGTAESPIELRVRRLAAVVSPLERESLLIEVINRTQMDRSEELSGIFTRYKRLGARAGIEGSGIGLYVVQAVAQAHEGRADAFWLEDDRLCLSILIPATESADVGP